MLLLNHDILFIILPMIESRSLLSLALTCRGMRDIIIPAFLYVEIPGARAIAFLKRVAASADGLKLGSAVRFLACETDSLSKGGCEFLEDALQKMPNLRSIHFFGVEWVLGPRIEKILSSLPNLQDLSLVSIPSHILNRLEGIGRLRSICIILDGTEYRIPYKITPRSGVGKILLDSRQTLAYLDFRGASLHMGDVFDDGDFVWPHVHTIICNGSFVNSLDVARIFPSTRCFSPDTAFPLVLRSMSHSQFFLARLESIRGDWAIAKIVRDAGGRLRRFRFRGTPLVDVDLEHYFCPALRSLHVNVGSNFDLNFIEKLCPVAPNLSFLAVQFSIHGQRDLPFTLVCSFPCDLILTSLNSLYFWLQEKSIVSASHLPLKYLSITWETTSSTHLPSYNQFMKVYPTEVISFIPASFHSLRVIDLKKIFSPRRHWWKVFDARDEGALRWVELPAPDGSDARDYYDWEWMEQVAILLGVSEFSRD